MVWGGSSKASVAALVCVGALTTVLMMIGLWCTRSLGDVGKKIEVGEGANAGVASAGGSTQFPPQADVDGQGQFVAQGVRATEADADAGSDVDVHDVVDGNHGGLASADVRQVAPEVELPTPNPLPAEGIGADTFRTVCGVTFRVNTAPRDERCSHDSIGFSATNKWGYNVRCPQCGLRVHVRWCQANRGLARPALRQNILHALREGRF